MTGEDAKDAGEHGLVHFPADIGGFGSLFLEGSSLAPL